MVFLRKEPDTSTTEKRGVWFINFLVKGGDVYQNMIGREICPFLVYISKGL